MTFLATLLFGIGLLLLQSGIDGTSIQQALQDVINGGKITLSPVGQTGQ